MRYTVTVKEIREVLRGNVKIVTGGIVRDPRKRLIR